MKKQYNKPEMKTLGTVSAMTEFFKHKAFGHKWFDHGFHKPFHKHNGRIDSLS